MNSPATIPRLDPDHPVFPPVTQALTAPNGLLAVGGNLQPTTLITAYRHGTFPWFSDGEPILWWSPDPRMILLPDAFKVAKSLRKWLKHQPLQISQDQAFAQVIAACAAPRSQSASTWITAAMSQAYNALHAAGLAHSVEIWRDGALVGGLYGVAIGRVFFGESMFSRYSNASKVALAWLCQQLSARGFAIIDCQVYTAHLASLGATLMPREDFIQLLQRYCQQAPTDTRWSVTQSTYSGTALLSNR